MGFLHIYTGNGKGKTTCAVGLIIRALGAGMRVAFCQFDKGFDGNNEHYHERFVLKSLPGVDLFFFGMERMMPDGNFRFKNTDDDLAQANAGLEKATELLANKDYDMIVCDELVTCIGTKLLTEADLLQFIAQYRKDSSAELVLTGRGATPALIDAADLVTEMNLVKHYWYKHKVEARKGIEY